MRPFSRAREDAAPQGGHGERGGRPRAGRRRGAVLVVAVPLVLLSCSRPECSQSERAPGQPTTGGERPSPDAAEPPPLELVRPSTRPRPPPPAESTFLGQPEAELLRIIATAPAVGARGTSGSSLSLFLNLEGPVDAAFKPRTKTGQKWSGEVAAYRLARLLKVGRVPPTVSRRFRIPPLKVLLEDEPELMERLDREAVLLPRNSIVGAVSYWVPQIHEAEVDREEELERWTIWLRQKQSIPPERLLLARQLSDLIVFDYVTGNWDRWSGGNVLFGPDERTLLIMDNNAAFNVRMSKNLQAHLSLPLDQIERFSAGLYRRLVGLSAADVRAELAEDPEGAELLTDAQIEALLARRDAVVSRIEALVETHGRDAVLCFP